MPSIHGVMFYTAVIKLKKKTHFYISLLTQNIYSHKRQALKEKHAAINDFFFVGLKAVYSYEAVFNLCITADWLNVPCVLH